MTGISWWCRTRAAPGPLAGSWRRVAGEVPGSLTLDPNARYLEVWGETGGGFPLSPVHSVATESLLIRHGSFHSP